MKETFHGGRKMKNELRRNRFGIDKICVALNPLWLKEDIPFNKLGIYSLDGMHYVNLVKKGGVYVELQINQEAFNSYLDHKMQVAAYLPLLLEKGLLQLENNFLGRILLLMYYDYIIIGLTRVEIYIDSKPGDVEVIEDASFCKINDAKQEEGLFCYENSHNNSKTFYSYDYTKEDKKKNVKRHDSLVCMYDKRIKDLSDNHINKESILKHKYSYRMEWRIDISNSNWLNLDNIRGSARQIFNRYAEYMAFIYNNYLRDNVEINVKNNREFNKVLKLADHQLEDDVQRFRSKKLKNRNNEKIKNNKLVDFRNLSKESFGEKENCIRENGVQKINEIMIKMIYLQMLLN